MSQPQPKSIPEVATEVWNLTRDYAKQETLDPLKGVARYVGFGLGGALVGGLGVVLLMLSGLRALQTETGTTFEGSWDWGQLWVVFALVTFAASFVTGLFVISPLAKKLPVVGPATPEGQDVIRRIFSILRVDLAYMYAIVFAMTVKPTTDDLGVVLVAALVLAALTALFLAPLRGSAGAPEGSSAATAE